MSLRKCQCSKSKNEQQVQCPHPAKYPIGNPIFCGYHKECKHIYVITSAQDVERKSKQESERKLKQETERKLKQETERKLKQESERKLKQETERKLKQETERKLKQETERKLKQETERKLKQESERKLKQETERKLKQETERKLKQETERKLKQETERKLKQKDVLIQHVINNYKVVMDKSLIPMINVSMPSESYLRNIGSRPLGDLLSQHYKERERALVHLNDMWLVEGEYKYPNLDIISNFAEYFHVNDRLLCNIKPKKIFGEGKAGIAMLIEIEQHPYIMKIIKNVAIDPYLSLDVHAISNYDPSYLFYSPSISYNSHKFSYKNDDHTGDFVGTISASGNNFSNQTMMHLILNNILGNIPEVKDNFIHQFDAFYCENNGHNIMDIAEHGDLSSYISTLQPPQINDDLIYNIMSQLLLPLAILKCKKYGFVHGDLKCKNVFVGSTVDGKIKYKLADFDKSSIYWKNIRFHTRFSNKLTGIAMSFAKKAHKGYPVNESIYVGNYYHIYDSYAEQIYTMYTAKPIHMSYDIYTLVCSLLREPIIYSNYMSGHLPLCNNLLDTLFDATDKNTMLNKISEAMFAFESAQTEHDKAIQLHKLRSITTITSSLANLKLKVNIDETYQLFGCPSNYTFDKAIDQEEPEQFRNLMILLSGHPSVTGSKHICVSPCIQKGCDTNKYSSVGFIYTKDKC